AQPTQTDLAVKETLERLYGDYERGRLDAPSLDAEHRELLRQELDWFGELALAPADGPNPAERDALLASARRTMIVIVGALTAGAGLRLARALGLIGLLGGAAMGRLRRGLTAAAPHHGVYAETFAVWLVLFLLLSVGAALVRVGESRLLVAGLAMLLSLVALGWPVLRGVPWAR